MKKIFITIPWFHPAFRAGGPVQSIANLVKEYNEHVTYYIFCGNADLNDIPLEVKTGEWTRYNDYTQVWYANKDKRSQTLVELSEKIKPDIIYIIGIYSWHFNVVPLLFCKASNKIISVRGMLHPGALSQKSIKKKGYLFLWKFFDLHKKGKFHATDLSEANYIEQKFGDEITVVQAANFPRIFHSKLNLKPADKLRLISVGLISPMKNHLLVIKALRQVTERIEYLICGPIKDNEYWNLCLEEMQSLPDNIRIQYLGEVSPDEVEAILAKGDVFIMPSKSENFGHALIEALSAGKPLITSHHTPWQKLAENRAGMNVDLTEDAIANSIKYYARMLLEAYAFASHQAIKYAGNAINIEEIRSQYRNMFKSANTEE